MKLWEKRVRNTDQQRGLEAGDLLPGGGVQPARRLASPGTASPHPCWASANPGAEFRATARSPLWPCLFPAPLPPVVPAAPEPRESAATAQVPEAALTPQVGAARPPPGARTAPAGAGFRRARFPSLLPTAAGSGPFPAQLGRSLGSGVGDGHQLPAASRDRPPWQHSGASSACLRPGFLQSRRRQLGRALLPGQVALDCRAALAPGRS